MRQRIVDYHQCKGNDYHQCKGHSTDECFKLRHDIQDLIDSGKITKPSDKSKPSTKNNPLPQYQYNYPPRKSHSGGSVNAIGSGLSEETRGKEIAVDGAKKKVTEKDEGKPKEKKNEEEGRKRQKKTVEVGESSQNKTPSGVTV
ncbi:uncharacterized protein LOC119371594 [Jatropha curcas]|uniref:uncharacterized protein LOC119371594 n=1 Tax=Jatropha curcas TaxID=180498 RepID=UPI001893496D|nr:uncharacterized protein LOC119371594 [Jatropha curcas]